jgi:mono/diheme cytochrome c family protein
MLRRRGDLVIAGTAFAVALAAAILIASLANRGATGIGRGPVARGELIYRAGTDAHGTPIPFSGGMMMRASCAGCHGRDGRGRSTAMFTAPDITYPNLTDPRGMLEPDGSRGPTFTDGALKQAITKGIDPEGGRLAWPMPLWQLTGQEWTDLLSYLKTLR